MFLGEMNCPEDEKQEESQPSKDMGEEAGRRDRIEHTSCSMEYDPAIKKNKMLPFVATRMDLGIMPSETSQRKANTVWQHLCMDSKKYNKLANIAEKK